MKKAGLSFVIGNENHVTAPIPAATRAVGDFLDIQLEVVRGTAEFMWRYKRQLHKTGMVDFALPRGADCPPWMIIVLDLLRLRGKTWRVTKMRGDRGGTKFRVEWLRWAKFRKMRSS
jgi:hypothetical protein